MKAAVFIKHTLAAALLSVGLSAVAAPSPQAKQPPQDFSAIQAVTLENKLPGRKIPYFIRNDEGERRLVGGMVLNTIARAVDTDGDYEMMTWVGGKEAGLPLYSLKNSHQAFYVIEGKVEFWLDGKYYLLTPGDYASVPPGVKAAFRFQNQRNKILLWATGSDMYQSFSRMGEPFSGYVQPETAKAGFSREQLLAATTQNGSLTWFGEPKAKRQAAKMTLDKAPNRAQAYVLAEGAGERYVVGDQMFTYLGDAKASDGRFIALLTEGPKGDLVPPHFHGEHTEIFYPLIGRVNMLGNKQQLEAQPGDAVHIPAGVVHSYQIKDHYTKFIGFLTPAVFDNFFRTLGDPYQGRVYPSQPGPVQFQRVIQNIDKLDIYLQGGKPEGK
ncbi:quercetin 2,3-dioxygenase [Neisseria sp. CCUG17229]|uniref:quercetin 2,3-dioxygenase n=1 Tax=Neisseria sp. CCUG17229 TaxID=3392036 RepID=UPI003A0FE5DD